MIAPGGSMPERIGPKEAQQRIERDAYVYVDVRTVGEFDAGHPAGAYNAPLMIDGPSGRGPNASMVAAIERTFAKDDKLVVGCLAGGRAMRAAEMLEAAGFTHVAVQRAGWGGLTDPFGRVTEAGWQTEGLPTATKAEPGRAWRDLEAKLK
jgi:rhodanese-related sulfurtransferase